MSDDWSYAGWRKEGWWRGGFALALATIIALCVMFGPDVPLVAVWIMGGVAVLLLATALAVFGILLGTSMWTLGAKEAGLLDYEDDA